MLNPKQRLVAAVDSMAAELRALALYIGQHPELGFQEYLASSALVEFLEGRNIAVRRGAGGLDTAFRVDISGLFSPAATLPSGLEASPCVALLAEYDALPELGHACGHNLSGVASVAAAIALHAVRHDFSGSVRLLGTPSEEGVVPGAGAKLILLEQGEFAGVDAALMAHMAGESSLRAEFIARAALEMDFTGRAAHAAAAPEQGINAMDAAVCAVNAINALRQQIPQGTRVHGYIVQAGSMLNTIPDFSRLAYGVRAPKYAGLADLVERVTNCARGAAQSTGCTFTCREISPRYAHIRYNAPLTAAFGKALEFLNSPFAENSRLTASSDMGNISLAVPSIHPMIGLGNARLALHTQDFAAAACSEAGVDAMLTAAKALALTAWDILTNASLRADMADDFTAGAE